MSLGAKRIARLTIEEEFYEDKEKARKASDINDEKA